MKQRILCNWVKPLAQTLPLAVALMAIAGSAAGQEVADAKKVNSLGGVMLALVMVLGVVIVSFMSPRRGPQE